MHHVQGTRQSLSPITAKARVLALMVSSIPSTELPKGEPRRWHGLGSSHKGQERQLALTVLWYRLSPITVVQLETHVTSNSLYHA